MGGQNVGNLNATLSLADFEFINGLKRSSSQLSEFAGETERQSRRVDRAMASTGKGGFGAGGFQAIGYAAQDFTSQIENGLKPAIASTTNNLMQITSSIPGVFGALATAAVIALPFVVEPLAKMTGLWEDNKKAIDEYKEKQNALLESSRRLGEVTMAARDKSPEALESEQERLKRKIANEERVLKIANEQYQIRLRLYEAEKASQPKDDSLATTSMRALNAATNPFAAMGELINEVRKGGKGTIPKDALKTIGIDTDPLNKKLLDEQDEAVKKQLREIAKLKQGLDRDGSLLAESRAGEAERKQKQRKEAADKADGERMNRGVQEAQRMQVQALETYGTASQKLTAKQRREREELSMRMRGLVEEESSLALQAAGHEVEQQKLKISETEAAIAKMGKSPGMSAGLRSDSVEGISQSNRWAQGDNGLSIQQQQLDVQKQQLKLMEQAARGETLGAHEKAIMNDVSEEPILGPVASRNSVAFNGSNGNRFTSANQDKEAIRIMTEQLKALTDIAGKPVSKVVGL